MKEKYLPFLLLTASLVGIASLAIYSTSVFNQVRYPLLAQAPILQEGWVHTANISKLQEDIGSYLKSTGVPHSFYASHLQNGTPVKANERNVHVAASLLKLPVAMNVMRQVELGNISLDRQVKIESHFQDKRYGSLYKEPAGSYISVQEALRLTLVESDNTALNALKSLPNSTSTSESVFDALNTGMSYDVETETLIDTQSYAQIIRCLYFSCYLTKDSSQMILELMVQSPPGGISAGLPENVKVAHKVGISGDDKNDCGIVYAEENSYIFCIMLDTGQKNASQITAKVSRLVHDSFVRELSPR